MKNIAIYGLLILVIISCKKQNNFCVPVSLKCEHLVNPLGIDISTPRFSWQMSDVRTGAMQTAYQLIVGTDSLDVLEGNGNMWDTRKIEKPQNRMVYNGKPLQPFTMYYWAVKIWDLNGHTTGFNKVANFETGMMHPFNWKGDWISDSRDQNIKPAPVFRKTFDIQKPVKSARIYIACAGLYELSLNGEKVGDHCLDPMFTRYDRRNLYVTYDVSDLIGNGRNSVGVLLGNGWYNLQSTAVWYFDKAPWRARPKFCLDLHINYADGSQKIIFSGTDWTTSLSSIIFNSIYTGEHVDARLVQEGWDLPHFDDSDWKNAIPVSAPTGNIVAQSMQPIRHIEEIPTSQVTKFSNTDYVFDLGRNISGISKLKVTGQKGTTIRLIHAERLDIKGKAELSNINMHYRPTDDSDPFQTDIFILSGKDEETFMPHFNYKGFQYVEVISDKPVELNKENLTGIFMHSDVLPIGSIHSSNPTLNKIWAAANNSYLSNLFGYPTDCPQREKNGWTGDAQINIETGLYNFDGIKIYEKWLADHFDEQQPNGVLPAIIPTSGWGYHWANGPDWTSTIAIIPWNIYLFYGDTGLLQKSYTHIKRYVNHITDESPNGLTSWGLGDWVPVKSVAEKEFTSSIYYFVDARILAKAAQIFGFKEDAEHYSSLAEKIRNAINEKYLNEKTGVYGNGLQTELSAALFWGIVPDSLKSAIAKNLAERVINDDKHIDVGLLGTKTILNALSENGYADLAYEVGLQETYPSWGWWIKNGATTFYENWNIDADRDISLNHIMFGEINAWFYKALGGIYPDEENPGFDNIILKPNFVKGLNFFEAKHAGPYGEIISSWEKEENNIHYKIIIPPNSTASLNLSNKMILHTNEKENLVKIVAAEQKNNFKIYKLESGEYSFIITE